MPRRNDSTWVGKVHSIASEEEFLYVLKSLGRDPDRDAIISSLSRSPDPVVRAWAGTASRHILGLGARSILRRLASDPDADVRDSAREDLLVIDPMFETEVLVDSKRVLSRGVDPHGEDRAAMWRLAKARDQESVHILRAYAARFPESDYAHRMPMVLAEYLDDPSRIVSRIVGHDHEWMFWLVQALDLFPSAEAIGSLKSAIEAGIDDECIVIIRAKMRVLQEEASGSS